MAKNDSSDSKASDSAKKVSRAAKAGATPSSAAGREQRDLGFPMALAAIVIAGSALVFLAWNGRDVAAFQPTFDDHWHLPYGIYDCTTESFLPNLQDPQTVNAGIHTHSDGVIHVHPYSSTATGNNAQLVRFLEATRTEIENDETMTFSDREELAEGVECDGEPAILQIARFAPGATTPSEVITEDLVDFRFTGDLEGVVIALAPEGAEIPPPPAASVAEAEASSPNVFRTDGLQDLDGSNTGGIGFDDDGNLVGPDGELILGDDDEPINRADLEAQIEGSGDTESDDTESDDTESDDTESDDG